LKNRRISLFFPSFSLNIDRSEREMMNSRGLEYEAWLVHFKGLKVKVSGLRILFVEVCE